MIPMAFDGVQISSFDLPSVGHVSYLIVDEASRTAAVIDPQPDVDPYLDVAARGGARIRHVFLTKLHSDFEGGQRTLAERTGAVVYVGARVRPDYPHLPVKDGDALQFGSVALRILETPGHTLEGVSILVSDARGSALPWGLFSGDLLFEGDLARPEPRLDEGYTAIDLARMLRETLRRRVLPLPPATPIFPGHRTETSGGPWTLGALRRRHPLLRPMTDAAFARAVTAGMLPLPLHAGSRRALNRGARPARLSIPALSAPAFLALLDRGAVPLDVREPMEFAAAHLRGSLSLGLGGRFEEWAPAVLDPTEDYALIANPGSEEEAAARLRPLVGGRILGCLAGGMTSLGPRPGLLERASHALVPAGRRDGRRTVFAARVDVRPAGRAARGAGRRMPLEELLGRLGELPLGGLAVTDEDPYRAHSAASLLRRRGWARVRPLIACPS